MTRLRSRARHEVGAAADCILALLDGDEVDLEARDEILDAIHARRTVGAELLAEAALSLIAIRKGLEKL